MSEVLIFKNPQFGEVRTAGSPDEPQFCLADVCKALGLVVSQVMKRLDDGVVTIHPISDSLGRTQQANFVNEDGLYDVILDSRKPEARKFRKWITSEVLPSIRKSGGYMVDRADETDDELMARALRIANDTLERAKRKTEQMERENKRLQCDNEVKQGQIEALQPDADYTRKTLASTTTWNTNIIAKEMGMSAVTLNKRLEMIGVQYKQHGVWVLSCSYTGKGYTENQTYPYIKSDGSVGTRIQMEWTENGRRFLHTLHNNGKI